MEPMHDRKENSAPAITVAGTPAASGAALDWVLDTTVDASCKANNVNS